MDPKDDQQHDKTTNSAGNQPTTDSEIKEDRIAARRKRVRAKIEADKRAALGEEPEQVCLR